jgi:two-component system response regulator HydG
MQTKRVLVLGDQPQIENVSKHFGGFSHGHTYDVVTASNGAQAASALSQGRPDLLVLEPQMKGLDGLAFLKRVRTVDPSIPVIAVTGTQESRTATEAMQAGVFACIPKPCDFVSLEHLVGLALSGRLQVGRS